MDKRIAQTLNDQIGAEVESSYMYLHMASWVEERQLQSLGLWLRDLAREEVGHALVLFTFLRDRSVPVTLGTVAIKNQNFTSLRDIMETLVVRAQYIAATVQNTVDARNTTRDKDITSLLTWLISVQGEEHLMVASLMDRLRSRQILLDIDDNAQDKDARPESLGCPGGECRQTG